MKMKLEFLPNELLLELFDYIDDMELVRIFFNLNARLNSLFLYQSKRYHLNFQSLAKQDLNMICRRSLPTILDRIVSLHLSDDGDTPYQMMQFFSYNFSLRQMTHLTTLSLYHLRSSNVLNQILSQLSRLRHLTFLKIDQIHFGMEETDQFTRIIWSLSKLTHFHIAGESFHHYCCLPELTIYASFKHLYMMDSHFTIEQLTHLLECALYLEHLSITVCPDPNTDHRVFDQSLRNLSPSLTVLKIKFVGVRYLEGLQSIFQLLPNLHELQIEIDNMILNGYRLEQMLGDYFSKLQIFHLQMSFSLDRQHNTEEYVEELLHSFRTAFWLDEWQLFFRCQWRLNHRDNNQCYSLLLYTLPYAFDTFDCSNPTDCKSTCPSQTDYWFYNRVRNLSVLSATEKLDVSRFPVRFLNIDYLTIGNDIEIIEKICPLVLDRLSTLHIYRLDCQYQSQLQTLLDRAPRLQTMIFEKSHGFTFFVTSTSVRRLIIRDKIYYNVQQCAELCTSILFHQCEVLEMNLRTRGSVLDLLRKIPTLRVLLFKCEHDQWRKNRMLSLSTPDELVKWLKHYLPSGCMIQREKDKRIRLWIR